MTRVCEGAGEVDTLYVVPHIPPASTSLTAQATKVTSLIAHQKLVKIFRTCDLTLN